MSEHTNPHPIPFIYRLVLTWIEPLLAIGGAVQITFYPADYLAIANPNIKEYYHPALQPLFTQIMGGWLMMVFNDLVTLRVFSRDLKVWTFIMATHLISDVVYTYALYQDLGAVRFFDIRVWEWNDWLTVGTTIPPLLLKMSFLFGLGLGPDDKHSGAHREPLLVRNDKES
jgi:hypothetical protein